MGVADGRARFLHLPLWVAPVVLARAKEPSIAGGTTPGSDHQRQDPLAACQPWVVSLRAGIPVEALPGMLEP